MWEGKVVAGTGHRPNKLGGYSKDVSDRLFNLACHALRRLKPTLVVSGVALGWDMELAEAAYSLSIPFDAYRPFSGQESRWPKDSQVQYIDLLDRARRVVTVCDGGYAAWKMQTRNEAMVDAADVVLALYDGSTGGTHNCVQYAHRAKKPVLNLWQRWMAGEF